MTQTTFAPSPLSQEWAVRLAAEARHPTAYVADTVHVYIVSPDNLHTHVSMCIDKTVAVERANLLNDLLADYAR